MDAKLKNILLAGIGAAAYSYDKAMDMVEDFVKKGELTVNQGKELTQELKRTVEKCHDTEDNKKENLNNLTVENLKDVLASLNLATKEDIKALDERINNIEKKDL